MIRAWIGIGIASLGFIAVLSARPIPHAVTRGAGEEKLSAEVSHPSRPRVFRSGFESFDEFQGHYVTRSGQLGTAYHDLQSGTVHGGRSAHRGWITGANRSWDYRQDGPNHRAYPTIQLHKLRGGGFATPCMVTLWVWLDTPAFDRGEWISFATLSADATDRWKRVVCVNLGHEGTVHLMHVPRHNRKDRLFQTNDIRFPFRRWVELKMYIDLSEQDGFACVWQDGALVSAARVEGGRGRLEQAHFGLYAAPSVASGVLLNDDLVIEECDRLDSTRVVASALTGKSSL
jgi:hypothetical protein